MSAEPAIAFPEQFDAPLADARFAAPKPVTPIDQKKPNPNLHNQAKTRRRKTTRDGLKDLIEPNWQLMAPIFVLAAVLMGIGNAALPSLPTMGWLAAGTGIAALNRFAARFERDKLDDTSKRSLLMTVQVGLPMMLFGLSAANWIEESGGHWEASIGILVIVGALAAVILNRRVSSVITSQVALWFGVALISGSSGTFVALAIGAVVGLFTTVRQARADSRAEREDRERQRAQLRAEEILHDFEQTGQGWFWETDRRGHLVYVSPTIGRVLERPSKSLLGRPISELFEADPHGLENERTLSFHLSARSAFGELAMRAATDKEERWWSISGRPLYDHFGNFLGFRGSGHDLTEKRRSEENASRLAHYDSLTGLANRLQMSQTLEKILASPNIEHRACAVFLIDLDRFKQVNDTMGHPAGDALLTQVASRLERAVGQYGRVGRLGGDEFQVVLPGRHRREDLAGLAQRVIHGLSEPYSIDGHRVMIGASVGVALSPEDGVTAEALIRNADLALYAAKDGGRGRHHFYAADLHSDAEERRQLEQDLRDALAQGGLRLFYQPVVHTSTERITGFEALLRWTHPIRGPISPAKFIPIAEDSGLIAQIGEWALRQACHDLALLPESVRVAVNVSPLQFANPALPSIITNALASAQVNPARLELEITESVFLNDDEGTDSMFLALKRVGVRLSLDDFGTGYSSLAYLKRFPVQELKIDILFVRNLFQSHGDKQLVRTIIDLARNFELSTVAEGVEDQKTFELLRELGCDVIQGFLFSKALSSADFMAWYRQQA